METRIWIATAGTLLAAMAAGAAQAQEVGRVLSSTPVMQAVTVQQQVCAPQQVATPAPKTGAGAVIGAVAGGAVGNAIGKGTGRAVATGVGIVGGAMLGNSVEGGGQPQVQTVQQCSMQNVVENRVAGYDVVYEYGGKQFAARMPADPGPYVRLQITPIGPAQGAMAAPAAAYPAPAAAYPAPVYPAASPYPVR